MDREEIKMYLPHREPMLLVDCAEVVDDATVVGSYRVRGDEFFLQGHFPARPVVPGVVLCEIMGQVSALVVKDSLVGRIPVYTGIDRVRFRAEVGVGDTVEVHATLAARRGAMVFVDAAAETEGRKVCEGRLAFKILETKS